MEVSKSKSIAIVTVPMYSWGSTLQRDSDNRPSGCPLNYSNCGMTKMATTDQYAGRGTLDTALGLIAPFDKRIVRLDSANGIDSRNFEYADLLKRHSLGRQVQAVIEKDGSPLIYVAEIPESASDVARDLARLLGNRGETALLLDVHRAGDSDKTVGRAWPCMLDASGPTHLDLTNPGDAKSVLGDLQAGLWSEVGVAHQEQRLRDLLVTSVERVSNALLQSTAQIASRGTSGHEVLALIGRALFTRFLLDRGILTAATAPDLWEVLECQEGDAFATAQKAAATCQWLDRTFNGEFMPLPAGTGYPAYFEALFRRSPEALAPLGWIIGRTDAGGQLPLWNQLDFSHIPSGTLSEVYEDYAHRRSRSSAKQQSVHFTPRHIARMMVRQAFAGMPDKTAADAKVLDPAVGAAVFLSLSFRELARLHAIRAGDVWPDTAALRQILYRQLRGMDINADALNLAALTLYLTAIELDANPIPPEKLRFDQGLLGTVLHDVGGDDPHDPAAVGLGSLRRKSAAGTGFDIVIGNPPWTSIGQGDEMPIKDDRKKDETPKTSLSARFTRETERVAAACIKARTNEDGPYEHPDKVPDIAFFWKATEWAKPGAIISLIVHQRLLIKQSKQWKNARQALLASVEVDGILNAGDFANHHQLIWPGIESPFCILFARNQRPRPEHRIVMLSLAVEPPLLPWWPSSPSARLWSGARSVGGCC